MTTTMNQTTTPATTSQDYWTATAGFVALFATEESVHCEEVSALTSKWDQHKFGLCCECDCGLDDEADFVITGNVNDDDIVLMCYTCFTNLTQESPYYAY